MCLAIPGRVLSVTSEFGLRSGRVDFSGTVITACLEYVPEAAIGDYVLVHAGVAISVLDQAEAERTLRLWNQMLTTGPDSPEAESERDR